MTGLAGRDHVDSTPGRPLIVRALAWVTLGTWRALIIADDIERMVCYLTPLVFIATGFLVDSADSRFLETTLILLRPRISW